MGLRWGLRRGVVKMCDGWGFAKGGCEVGWWVVVEGVVDRFKMRVLMGVGKGGVEDGNNQGGKEGWSQGGHTTGKEKEKSRDRTGKEKEKSRDSRDTTPNGHNCQTLKEGRHQLAKSASRPLAPPCAEEGGEKERKEGRETKGRRVIRSNSVELSHDDDLGLIY